MIRMSWKVGALALAAGLGGVYLAADHRLLSAREPNESSESHQKSDEATTSVSGRVAKLLRNGRGDLDGLKLEEGPQIHFPPHMEDRVAKIVKVGDQVAVQGRKETRRDGDLVLEAARIESGGQSVVIEHPAPPRGPAGKRPPRKERDEPWNTSGEVREFAKNPHGDVDGLLLADGTAVKLPPHRGRELQALVKTGEKVRIEGRRHRTPHGDVHLHADRIVATASGKTLEREDPADAPHRHKDDVGPDAKDRPEGTPPREAGADPVQRQILDELKGLRRHLEELRKKP